ncbi:hypothetical protein GSI_13588 [Ganoderma sinense ZZ0214-1]|uniref:Uncharacterized protein n=1 Tax=Ganoderma sinense ZZ0214-1 TaxID=1077348 RepID=A0A2G8RQQ6_9APHY|nr:hypothetical protein GSI_13588 [Ganoderma sinense ZZ0214-1]
MTSTMTEAFDTHMTDPGDIDISMYTGTAATDSWLPVEASMSDDAYAADAATFHYNQGAIEIEMGDDDEPITEYEMADEGQAYDGLEIQDIEVYDISQVPSPLPADDHDIIATTQSHVEDAEVMNIPSSEDPAPEPTLELHTTAPEVPVISEEVVVGDSIVPADLTDSSVVVNYDSTVYQPDPTSAAGSHLAEAVLAPLDDGVPQAELPSRTSGHFKLAEATRREDLSSGQTVESHSQPPEFAQHENHATQDLVGAEDHLHANLLDESAAAVGQDENDPHEISDGVYIDPPPAVLLSLPPSAEFGECCLFNLPPSSARQSPSSSAQPDTGDTPRLLLQERPTLYYEPLSAVFAALRQEEGIQRMHGFAEAELVLDAYDLQLSIPEDNIYTHEVTLHELNVIHDGSDLGGPLRLRLKVFAPRFVARYNMLRDQISRLNFAEDGERHPDVAPPEHYEPEYVEHDVHQADEGGEQGHYEDDTTQEPRFQFDEEHTGGVALEVVEAVTAANVARGQEEGETHKDTDDKRVERLPGDHVGSGGGVVTGVDPAFQAAQLEAAEEEVAEEDADADGEYDESETFDADEVHEHTTIEEGGDYTEHAEFPDDEDEFGEDLPEEVGGETKDAAYPHVGAVDDTPELPQDENDFEREVPVGVVGRHGEQQFDDTGLHTNPYTNAYAQSNSVEVPETGVEDPLRPTSETFTEEDVLNNLETDNVGHEETTILTEDAEDNGFGDNWDEADTLSSHENAHIEEHAEALSRKSSTTTLASGISKRAYEEVDLDDFDDGDDFFDTASSSPSAKRLRTE